MAESFSRTGGEMMRGIEITGHRSDCINVDLLGGLRVRAGQMTVGAPDVGGGRLRRVLLALILHRGSPVSKDRLISLLWEESPPINAKATLESYVCALRKKLEPFQGEGPSLITTVAGCYAFDMSRIDLDLARYERLMSTALRSDTSAMDALPMLQQAAALAEAPLLPEEIDFRWLEEVRLSHDQNVRKNLIAAATKVCGMPSGCAERWARLALEGDPLDESAWHALLTSLEASGQHADGLRAYDHCRRVFAAELGCAPGSGLQKLYDGLLRGANEDDEDLSRLFDAVVRVHRATRHPSPAPGSRSYEVVGQIDRPDSFEKACRTLNQLLLSVGPTQQRPETSQRAS